MSSLSHNGSHQSIAVPNATTTTLPSDDSQQCLFVQVIASVFFAAITLGTVLGNTLVIVSVCRFRYLRGNSSNQLICSLAVTDLVVGLVLMPLKAFNEVVNFGYWNYGYRLCVSWLFVAILCSTASSFHLLCIAIDRYLAINRIQVTDRSVQSRAHSLRLTAMITVSWSVSAAIALLPLTVWLDEPHFRERLRRRICFPSQTVPYKIASQIVVFYGPIVIMIPLCVCIYHKSRRQCLTLHSNSNVDWPQQQRQQAKPSNREKCSESSDPQPDLTTNASSSSLTTTKITTTSRRPCHNSARGTRREYRVAKTLLTVMLAYILFLAPFYVTTLTSAVIGQRSPPKLLYSLALWTLYTNSLVNPIIYAFLNRNFARAFKQLLCIDRPHNKPTNRLTRKHS